MSYLEEFVIETFKMQPLGKLTCSDGYEDGQMSLYIDGKEIGIYILWEDYANWLESKLNEYKNK